MSFDTASVKTSAKAWIRVKVERVLPVNGQVQIAQSAQPSATIAHRFIDTDDNHVYRSNNGSTWTDEGAPSTDQVEYDVDAATYKYWDGSAWTNGKGYWYFADRWLRESSQQWEGRVTSVGRIRRSIGDGKDFMSRSRTSVTIADPDRTYLPNMEMFQASGNEVTIEIALDDEGTIITRTLFVGRIDSVVLRNRSFTLNVSDKALDWYDEEFGDPGNKRIDQSELKHVPGSYQQNLLGS